MKKSLIFLLLLACFSAHGQKDCVPRKVYDQLRQTYSTDSALVDIYFTEMRNAQRTLAQRDVDLREQRSYLRDFMLRNTEIWKDERGRFKNRVIQRDVLAVVVAALVTELILINNR